MSFLEPLRPEDQDDEVSPEALDPTLHERLVHFLPGEGLLLLGGFTLLFAGLDTGGNLTLALTALAQMAVGGVVIWIRLQNV